MTNDYTSEWLLFKAKPSNCSSISWREQVNFQSDGNDK